MLFQTKKKQYIIDAQKNVLGVIFPIDQYMAFTEDLFDLKLIAERIGEETISFEDLRENLKAEGLIDS